METSGRNTFMNNMSTKFKKISYIYVILLFGLFCVCAPLIILGFYNYPMADDWSMGVFVYKSITLNDCSLPVAVAKGVKYWFMTGEPRFSAVLLGVIVPSAFGNEHFYRVVCILMLSGLILCEFYFFNLFFHDIKITVTITAIPLMLQILCVPYPTETFYWYVGSVNYTFINSLSLILIGLFFKLSNRDDKINKFRLASRYIIAIMLSILVGGNNFGTSLSRLCLFGFMSLMYLIYNRKKFFRTISITATLMLSLVVCLLSPGSADRLAGEYANAGFGPIESIAKSIKHTALAIVAYTDMKMILTIMIVLPFVAYGIKKSSSRMKFANPLVFLIITFLIYSSELVPNYYVEGAVRAQRMADIYFYEYFLFIITNTIYWTGWFVSKERTLSGKMTTFVIKHLMVYLLTLSTCILIIFAVKDLRTSSSYRAAVWLAKGYASEYRDEWEERLIVLKDPSITDASFDSINLYHELIYYADMSDDPNSWLNLKCAEYYGKNTIVVK